MKKKMIGFIGVSLLAAALVGCTDKETNEKEDVNNVEDVAINEESNYSDKLKKAIAKLENREFTYLKDVQWLMNPDEIGKELEKLGYELSETSPNDVQLLGENGESVVIKIYNNVELDKLGKGSLTFEFTNNLQPFNMEHYLDSKFINEHLLSRITFIKENETSDNLKEIAPELFDNKLVNVYESEQGVKQVFLNFSIDKELIKELPTVPLKIKSIKADKEITFKTNTDEDFKEEDGIMLINIEGLIAQKEETKDEIPEKTNDFEVSVKNKKYIIHIVDDKKLYISDVTTDEVKNYIVKQADGVILSLNSTFGLEEKQDAKEVEKQEDSKE